MEKIRRHRDDRPTEASDRSNGPDDLSGVTYPPREDSFLLLPFARVAAGSWFLEVGAGSGLAALAAARAGARAVATDLNPFALRALRRRAGEEGLSVLSVRTDLARGLGRFDRLLANPPYLPTGPEERDPDPWHNLALDGGRDGCRVLRRLVEQLGDHLVPNGSAFVVVSSLQAPGALARIRARWEGRGGRVGTVGSRELEGERLEVWRFVTGGSQV